MGLWSVRITMSTWVKNGRKLRLTVMLFLFTGIVAFFSVATNQGSALIASAEAASASQELIEGLKAGQVGKARFRDATGMGEYYQAKDFAPLWLTRDGKPNADAKTAIGALETSWTHGLNPLNYHVDTLRPALEEGRVMNPADFELLLSDAVIRYGRALTGMRVTPASVGQTGQYWQPPMRGVDILNWMSKNAGSTQSALNKLAPQGSLYKKLREELVKTLAEPDEKPRKPVRIDGNLRPGSRHEAVAIVREYLGVQTIPSEGADYYDDALAKKVMVFQEEHGFAPDGIIGPSTQKILNLSRLAKINQLVANLERQRWMDRVKPAKYVMVNIPSATLWAVEKGDTTLQMRVIVGKENRPTNSFKTTISGVRFNPTWTVPPTIKKEDYLPKLAQDPEYLTKRGIEIRQDGKTIDPVTVDWANLPWEQASSLSMVQNPGVTNPLGRVRVLMANNYNIYLHDTNDRSVFARNSRTLSSGCIRVEKPEELANFIMKENEGWSTSVMQALFDAGKMRDIRAANPIPVYLVYNTIWETDAGKMIYGYDLYSLDDQLVNAIKGIDGFKTPDNVGQIVSSSAFASKTGLDYRPGSR